MSDTTLAEDASMEIHLVIAIPVMNVCVGLTTGETFGNWQKVRIKMKAGDTVKAYGYEWEIMNTDYNGGILCLTKEPICTKALTMIILITFIQRAPSVSILRNLQKT